MMAASNHMKVLVSLMAFSYMSFSTKLEELLKMTKTKMPASKVR